MSKQTINIGASPNDGTGTPLRTSFDYTNQNFTELYTAVGPSGNNIVVPGNATITGDLGVGTASPSTKLEVATATANTRLRINSTSVVATEYFRSGTGVWLVGSDSTNAFKIARGSNFGGSADYLSIASATADCTWYDAAGGTRMTLNSTGLGIGASPATKLDVRGANNASQATFSGTASRGLLISTRSDGLADDRTVILNAQHSTGSLGQLVIQTAGTDRLLVDSSGNVGIGVTPSAWTNQFIAIEGGDSNSQSAVSFQTNANAVNLHSNSYYSTGYKYKFTGTAGQYALGGNQHEWYIAPSGTAGDAITFTQAMTLDASGNLLVGTMSVINSARVSLKAASVATVLSLSGATGDTAQESFVINKFDSNSTTSQVFARFTNGNGASGSGQINGNGANACAFGSFSDSRLKENILTLPSQLANILSLRPVEFDYKDGSGHQIGFVAQEMQEVYSDAVGEQNGFLTVTGWSKTEARLVSAIQELAAKVQALEAKLA